MVNIGLGSGISLAIGASWLFNSEPTLADEGIHPASYPWSHSKPWQGFDHARYLLRLLCIDSPVFVVDSSYTSKFVPHATAWIELLGETLWMYA